MSNLGYQNNNNRYKGWVNPSNLSFGPEIISLSTFQSPAGSRTVVSIFGSNFYSYSTIRFGTYTPTVYFINSTILQFYVPNILNSGTFTVQVCNGPVCSNSVNYTIDNASGFWLFDGQSINNSNGNNSGGVGVTWLSRGIPQYISKLNNSYQVPNNVTWIICDTAAGEVHISLPEGTKYKGRELMIKRLNTNSIITDTAKIKTFDESTTSDIIISNIDPKYNYSWVTLVFDGSIWITTQAG